MGQTYPGEETMADLGGGRARHRRDLVMGTPAGALQIVPEIQLTSLCRLGRGGDGEREREPGDEGATRGKAMFKQIRADLNLRVGSGRTEERNFPKEGSCGLALT